METSTKINFQIKNRWTGNIIFEYESSALKEAVQEAVNNGADLRGADLRGADLRYADLNGADLRGANLSGAYLRDADLSDADLRGANLRGADLSDTNLRGANLRGADLRGANLRGADLTPIKNDLFIVLLHAIHEIPNLKKAIIEGKIDGSTYTGECTCLSGTIHKGAIENNGPQQKHREDLIMSCRDADRPIERFFLCISPGDTPENNQAAKLVMGWIEEFERLIA